MKMSLNNKVKFKIKTIGVEQPVFIVVEIGVCHEQNIDVAKHFIDVAKESGADAIKIEAFKADKFVMDKNILHKYGTAEGLIEENYYQLLKRLELSDQQIIEIKKYADKKNILFFSTVHDVEDVDFFEELGVCAYKVASVDMLHAPLIKYLSQKKKTVFIDTGAAYVDEIERSLNLFSSEGFRDVILMHNPIGYPAPSEKTDLRMISTLQKKFNVPVGLSCHTPGFDMVIAAIGVGANVIEKPITRNKNARGPENIFSFLDTEISEFIYKIKNTEVCLGNKVRENIDEMSHARAKRRGVYAKIDLPKGHLVTSKDLIYRVPNKGISSENFEMVLNKKLTKSYKMGEALQLEDLYE